MLVIGFDNMRQIGHCGFYISCHYVDWSQMINLRYFKKLWFLFISILFFNFINSRQGSHWYRLFILHIRVRLILLRLYSTNFSGHGEMRKRAINNNLIQFILKQVLLHRQQILELADGQLTHIHYCPYVELVDPMRRFAHS